MENKLIILIIILAALFGGAVGYWYFTGFESFKPGFNDNGNPICVLENCHGMDIKCGPNPPDACTMMYGIGDRCLQYAKCGFQNNKCQQIENSQFTQCKLCVQACVDANEDDVIKMFECESKCE